jgi:hypothetical protein
MQKPPQSGGFRMAMTRLSGLQTAQTITCHRFAVCLNASLEKKRRHPRRRFSIHVAI